ncbi:uncharacterized protein DEA37_0003564 [Paragonimus westermani]|uniref:Synaptogyrin n=1 Tax=Paragonimus westermani TaxID=34504 RepID=A0A5J4NDG1_9TREM|nr:uncharacterized protein DEA37_0003564 [Paragonimus westermani]
MDASKLFGAAKAAGSFNAFEFFRKPVVILRVIAIVVSIIVFGCVASGGRTADHVCIFHGEASACSYAVGVGVLAFLGGIGLLVSDGMFNSISNIKRRRQVVIGDLAFSGLWTFLWFVSFCLLTNKWTNTEEKWLDRHKVEDWQENNARSAIVFSLVSTGIWAGLTFFALQRFRMGQTGLGGSDAEVGSSSMPGGGMSGPPGSMYSGIGDQSGQQPFATGGATQQGVGGDQYYSPTY